MKKLLSLAILTFLLTAFTGESYASWIWSPDIGKWINPKKAPKDTPEEQFTWALEFYNIGNWDRSIEEFEKLPENFPNSRLSAESVYYIGLCRQAEGGRAKFAGGFPKPVGH